MVIAVVLIMKRLADREEGDVATRESYGAGGDAAWCLDAGRKAQKRRRVQVVTARRASPGVISAWPCRGAARQMWVGVGARRPGKEEQTRD